MADPEESPDPESGSDTRHGVESDPYRPDLSPSDDEDTLFLPGEQLLTEVDAALDIQNSGIERRDFVEGSDQDTQRRKRKVPKNLRRKKGKDRTPLPSSSLSTGDPVPSPIDFDFPILTSVYWGNCPSSSEAYGTVVGENARLWMQAEVDLTLEDAPKVPVPGHKRPIDLLDVFSIPEQQKGAYNSIQPTPNREVISDILLNSFDESQIDAIRQSIHLLFEKCKAMIADPEALGEGRLERLQTFEEVLVFDAADCASVHTVPNVPSMFALPPLPDTVPQHLCLVSAEVQHKACRIMAFLESMLHTRMLVASDIRSYQNTLLSWIGYRSFSRTAIKAKDSLYKEHSLIAVNHHAEHSSLTPSPTLQSDVREGHFNTVKVPLSAAALLRCLEVLDTVYIRTASRRKAWLALSKKADHEHLLAESGAAFEPPPNPFLNEQRCKEHDLLCSFGDENPTETGNMEFGSENYKSRRKLFKDQHRVRMTNAGYAAAFNAFRSAFYQDALDREYQSGAARERALSCRKRLTIDAWMDFVQQWNIGGSEFIDAYSGIVQSYFETRSDWEARFPFLLSPDAVQPLCIHEGEPAIHV
ncbi:hypothetical protein KC336_g19249, partial [Hortaea werneckii]